jgi:hypothetical protein
MLGARRDPIADIGHEHQIVALRVAIHRHEGGVIDP